MKYVILTLGAVMFVFIGCANGMFPWWLLYLLLGGIFIFIISFLLRRYMNEPYTWSAEKMDKEVKKIRQKNSNKGTKERYRNISSERVERKPSAFRKTLGLWAGAELAREIMKKHHHDDTHDYTGDYMDYEGIDEDDMFD